MQCMYASSFFLGKCSCLTAKKNPLGITNSKSGPSRALNVRTSLSFLPSSVCQTLLPQLLLHRDGEKAPSLFTAILWWPTTCSHRHFHCRSACKGKTTHPLTQSLTRFRTLPYVILLFLSTTGTTSVSRNRRISIFSVGSCT